MDVLDWLLEPDDPSIRYRTLVELLDRSGTAEAREAKKAVAESEAVKKLMALMHPDGYWLQTDYKGRIHGADTEYGSFATTHFCLAYLAELGMERMNPGIHKAASRYLGLQREDGDWWQHLSCLYAYNIRTFIRLGYRDDQRVQKAIDLMLRTSRKDGGYLCDIHEKCKGRPQKSCVRGAAKALLAYSELPEYWSHERCRQLVDYFLDRNGVYRRSDPQRFVCKDMMSDSSPIIWSTNIWEILYGLARMGYGKDERLADAWKVLESRKGADGRYILDWTPTQCPWKVGKKGEPNKWITLYCMLAEKYRDN